MSIAAAVVRLEHRGDVAECGLDALQAAAQVVELADAVRLLAGRAGLVLDLLLFGGQVVGLGAGLLVLVHVSSFL